MLGETYHSTLVINGVDLSSCCKCHGGPQTFTIGRDEVHETAARRHSGVAAAETWDADDQLDG
jgi:hypothetical protein